MIYKKLDNVKDIEGAVIKKTVFDNWDGMLTILFFDDSYIQFEIEHGYEQGDTELVIASDEPDDTTKKMLGMITEAEYTRRQEERIQLRYSQGRSHRLAAYNRLKKEFER